MSQTRLDKTIVYVGSGAKTFLPNIQMLRFVAAAMVLVSHLDREVRLNGLGASVAPVMDAVSMPWACGVDLFFCISGFLMLYLTYEHFGERGYQREFLKRRVIRVVPLYWLSTLVFTLLVLGQRTLVQHSDITPTRLITSLLFVPYQRAGGDAFPVLALGWTLNFEVLFYLAFTLALGLRRRLGLGALIVGFCLASLYYAVFRPTALPVSHWTNPIILEFVFGLLIGWLHIRGVRLAATVQLALIVVGFASLVGVHRLDLAYPTAHISDLPRSVWAGPPCALILAGFMLGKQMQVGSALARALVLGGDASYSLYLTHMFATRTVTLVWRHMHFGGGWAFMAAGFSLALALALAVFTFVETPVLDLLRRKFEPRRSLVSA